MAKKENEGNCYLNFDPLIHCWRLDNISNENIDIEYCCVEADFLEYKSVW